KSEMPADVKVLETVSTGTIQPDAQIMLNIVKREFDQASLMNSIQMGQLPERQVKATEVVQASQNNSSLLESIVGDLEQAMELLVWKAWNVILQDMHHIEMKYLKSAVNQQAILQFAKMTPEERFVAFQNVNFKVRGLQATISRAKDFQKVMAVMQVIGQNPLLLQAFFKKYNPEKILDRIFKFVNINPEQFELSDDEKKQLQDKLQELQQFAQISGGGSGNAESQEATGGQGGPATASVNQDSNPLTGLTGGES
ncbi:MAG: hypothetical protein KGI05_08755, partial [Thaumarchaeota archaeon]|nr:hypothetical protein [Nitrososphaerota archaeon]